MSFLPHNDTHRQHQSIGSFSRLSSLKQVHSLRVWVCLMTVCIYWCASSIYCCELLVAKVMADAQLSAYSWHLSFLLSVRITHAQNHDGLSIPYQTRLSKRWDGAVFTGVKKKKGRDEDRKRTASELKLSTGICLTFPSSYPRVFPLPIFRGKELFSIYFIFIWASSRVLYIFICATIGVWEGSREVHHINCIDINSSLGALPLPLMRV